MRCSGSPNVPIHHRDIAWQCLRQSLANTVRVHSGMGLHQTGRAANCVADDSRTTLRTLLRRRPRSNK
eukprot:12323003-Prorocentrum_lima.AAC.1